MMWPLAALLLTLTLGHVTQGHKYSTKKCPYPTAVENFDESRILGRWQVQYAVRTTSTCVEFDFRQEDGTFRVYETKEPAAPRKVGLAVKYGSVGTLASTAEDGYYQASYSTSTISGRFIILDTDYDSYLVVFHCQQFGIMGSRRTVYLLTRGGVSVSQTLLDKVKSRMSEVDLEPGLLAEVSHQGCVSADTADVDLTGKVNIKDVFSTAKKVIQVGGGVAELIALFSQLG